VSGVGKPAGVYFPRRVGAAAIFPINQGAELCFPDC